MTLFVYSIAWISISPIINNTNTKPITVTTDPRLEDAMQSPLVFQRTQQNPSTTETAKSNYANQLIDKELTDWMFTESHILNALSLSNSIRLKYFYRYVIILTYPLLAIH